jgi:hypothetical protein
MTKPVLSFSLEQTSSYKIAEFSSIEEKNAYVDAEFANPTIKNLYLAYQSARTKKDRKEAAGKLDNARYLFYKKWAADKRPLKLVITEPPDVA